MKRSYTSQDIERAVEMAEEKGLDHFLDQHPFEKRRDTQAERNDLMGDHKYTTVPSMSIFDLLMFGPPRPKQDKENLHVENKATIQSSPEYPEAPLSLDDNLITCDPCEEVREIVRGIRAGKYKLKTNNYPTTQEPEGYYNSKGLRLPENWVSVKRSEGSSRDNADGEQNLISNYGNDGNMWGLTISLKDPK